MEEENEETQAFIKSLPYKIPTFDDWNTHAQFYHPLMAGSIDGTDIIPHDKAVIRACRSKYRPNKKVVGDPTKTLMIRHLSKNTNEATLSRIFSRFGDLEKCRLIRDVISGISRGYAFVEYKIERDARHALRESKGLLIDGNQIVADSECERLLPWWIPRRFGGGFGGKKESGQLRFGGIERPFRRPITLNSVVLGSKHNSQSQSGFKRDFRTMSDRSRNNNNQHNDRFREVYNRKPDSRESRDNYAKRYRR